MRDNSSIAIVGGGIAGLTLANLLNNKLKNISLTIYERENQFSDSGLVIDLSKEG